MTPYQQSVEAASKWKAAVEKLWDTQRSILIFGAIGTVSIFVACILLIVGLVLSEGATGMGTALIVSFALLCIAGLAFMVVAYVKQWVFYFDLKRWEESAPASLSDNIRTLAICTLISLIATIVAGVFQNLSFVLFFGFISSTVSFAAFAVEIVKLVMFIKLSGASAMPAVAKRGLTNIMTSYIVSFACSIFGVIIIVSSIITYVVSTVDGDSYDWDDDYYEHYDADDVFDYDVDDVFDYDDNLSVNTLLSGVTGSGIADMSDDEFDEFFDDFTDSELSLVLLFIGFIIIVCGSIVYVVLYYRGWWLISKSELPVLPEPVEDFVVDTPCEKVADDSVESNEAHVDGEQ